MTVTPDQIAAAIATNGADPGATQGQATLYLITATPVAA